ncbi:MAG: hypothetical protein J0H83_13490 [Candidatus Melainabacteria bacterium]|nr:hypothetical protein [Candidatus Melainabacteria bacterium]
MRFSGLILIGTIFGLLQSDICANAADNKQLNSIYQESLVAYRAGRYGDAQTSLAKALTSMPRTDSRFANCYYMLGDCAYQLREIPLALTCFERAKEATSNFILQQRCLAYIAAIKQRQENRPPARPSTPPFNDLQQQVAREKQRINQQLTEDTSGPRTRRFEIQSPFYSRAKASTPRFEETQKKLAQVDEVAKGLKLQEESTVGSSQLVNDLSNYYIRTYKNFGGE